MFRENIFNRKFGGDWISISDLMAGLMMIFLFIAISYMNSLQIRAKQIKKIAVAYQELQDDLYYDLNESLMVHPKIVQIVNEGVTHIHAHINESLRDRENEAADLIGVWQPVCNIRS